MQMKNYNSCILENKDSKSQDFFLGKNKKLW